jgi:hypothetical protein
VPPRPIRPMAPLTGTNRRTSPGAQGHLGHARKFVLQLLQPGAVSGLFAKLVCFAGGFKGGGHKYS